MIPILHCSKKYMLCARLILLFLYFFYARLPVVLSSIIVDSTTLFKRLHVRYFPPTTVNVMGHALWQFVLCLSVLLFHIVLISEITLNRWFYAET